MKKILTFLLLISVCFLVAKIIHFDQGYMLLSWGSYTLESSLLSCILIVLIFIFLLFLVISFFKFIFNTLSFFYPLTKKAKLAKSKYYATKGFEQYATGNWKFAFRMLKKAADGGQASLMTYLTAAKAAYRLNDEKSYLACLAQAKQEMPRSFLVINMTRAELLLENEMTEEAVAILQQLHKKYPKHIYILKLLKNCYLQLKDWKSLAKILPELKKRKVISISFHQKIHKKAFLALFEQVYQSALQQKEQKQRLKIVEQVWRQLTPHDKDNIFWICHYAEYLHKLELDEYASKFIEGYFSNKYDQRLIKIYGRLKQLDKKQQLAKAEHLLLRFPDDTELLLVLSKICLHRDLLGKADEYATRCLSITPSSGAFSVLGELYARQNMFQKSCECFQKALHLKQ